MTTQTKFKRMQARGYLCQPRFHQPADAEPFAWLRRATQVE
jgi:hypothetical protein